MKIIAIIKFKKYVINICIFSIVKNKLYCIKKLYLIILFTINKSLKINFYYIILSLNLAIYL